MMPPIELIILDLDGTLYDLNDVLPSVYETQVSFLCKKTGKSREDVIAFLSKNHIYKEKTKDSKSATELFLSNGLSLSEWTLYRETHFDVTKIDKQKAANEKTIKNFSQFGAIVLLSSNAYSIIERILSHLSISPFIFKEIVCSDRFMADKPFTKKEAMKLLSAKYHTDFTNMISIGDRFETDILPLLELGGHGVLLKSSSSISFLSDDFRSGKIASCSQYLYYGKMQGNRS